jgi:hypothetical protein
MNPSICARPRPIIVGFTIPVTTSAANFQHEIVLFSGSTCALARCNGTQAGTFGEVASSASITVPAVAGTRYFILVTGYLGTSDASKYEGMFAISVGGNGNATATPVSAPVVVPAVAPVAVPVVAPTGAPVAAPVTVPSVAPAAVLVTAAPVAVPAVATPISVSVPMRAPAAPGVVALSPSVRVDKESSAQFAVLHWTMIMATVMTIVVM